MFLSDELAEIHASAQQGLDCGLHLLDVVLQFAILTALALALRPRRCHPGLVELLFLFGEVQFAEDESAGGIQLQLGGADGLRAVLGETGDAIIALSRPRWAVLESPGLAGGGAFERLLLSNADGLVGLVCLDGLVADWVAQRKLQLAIRILLLAGRHFHIASAYLELSHHRAKAVSG